MSSGDASGKEILIATPKDADAQQLTELCESNGYHVVRARRGEEVLEAIADRRGDVLLLDMDILQPPGILVLKQIRDNPSWNDVPVVILTNADDLDTKVYGMEVGADDYMTRPFKPVELQTRVGSALMVREYRKRLVAVEAELAQLRALDPVSGAGTSAQLKTSLDSEIARARRYGRPASLLVMGIDGFDKLAERLGMQKRDDFVARLSKAIRHTLRGADRLFRVQPNEFVVMLPETDLKGARMAAERLNKIVAGITATDRQGQTAEVKVRFGGAVFPNEGVTNGDELVREASRSYRALAAAGGDKWLFDMPGQ